MKYIVLVLLLMSGCAYPKKTTDYAPYNLKTGNAVVYIYRTPTSIDSVNPDVPRFFVNDKLIGKLSIGGYYAEEVAPGKVDVSYRTSLFGIPMPWPTYHVVLKVEAGRKYFVKFSIDGMARYTDFLEVSQSQGEAEIKSTVLLVN